MDKYNPEGDRIDASVMYGYTAAQGLCTYSSDAATIWRAERHEAGSQIQHLNCRCCSRASVNTSPTDFTSSGRCS